MDPNACLARIADALRDNDLEDARWISYALLAWLLRGGFAPDWSKHPEAADYFDMVKETI